jgi:pimeloyl-[acyl-carrier protein] methyl ester esterase
VTALVLLHGWGMTPAVFDPLRARLERSFALFALPLPGYCGAETVTPYTVDTIAQAIAARAPERCVVCGWSLGAQAALAWARARPRQVEGLVLVAATPSFVTREHWPHAVEPAIFRGFAEAMQSDRDPTLNRFASLQAQGGAAMKQTALQLRASLCSENDASTQTLRHGLDVLLDTDLRESLDDIAHDALVIHGDRDRLVPLAAGEHIARTLTRARLQTIPDAAHAPFLTHTDAVAAGIEDFVR